jgi:hypothetical protein
MLLKHFIQKGYVINVTDVVVALARADFDTLTFVMRHFKPRMFTCNFRYWMLRIAHVRNDPRMCEIVEHKLALPRKQSKQKILH